MYISSLHNWEAGLRHQQRICFGCRVLHLLLRVENGSRSCVSGTLRCWNKVYLHRASVRTAWHTLLLASSVCPSPSPHQISVMKKWTAELQAFNDFIWDFQKGRKRKSTDSSTSCLLNPQQEGLLDPQFTSKHNSGHVDRESTHNYSFNCQLKTFPSGFLTVILQIQSKLPHPLHLNTNADHQARGCPNPYRNHFVHPHMFSDISLEHQKETSLFLQ